jgi:hypothetical protein
MPNLPHLAVREDHPLDALIHGVHLHLPKLLDTQLLSAALYFDKSDHLFINANAIVGEIALDLIFASKILIFVEPKTVTKKVGYEQSRITLICVALDKIMERFVKSPYSGSNSVSRAGLPLRPDRFASRRWRVSAA